MKIFVLRFGVFICKNGNYVQLKNLILISDEYDKHPNEVVKNEELTYNNNGGFSLMRSKRRSADKFTTFLFNWMPQQLSFIVLTLSLVLFINYMFVIQSIFVPNLTHIIRCKVPAGANIEPEYSETVDSSQKSSKLCQLASKQCRLANVPRADVGDSIKMRTRGEKSSKDDHSQLAHVSTFIQSCVSVKFIDKTMPPQLTSQKRSIVTTNFNDNTTSSSNYILKNTNTVLKYSKSKFVYRNLNRTYEEAKGTINLTNASIALQTATNSDNNKLNISSDKFIFKNNSCIRHNSIEYSSDLQHQQQQWQHKDHYSNLNHLWNGETLIQCFR